MADIQSPTIPTQDDVWSAFDFTPRTEAPAQDGQPPSAETPKVTPPVAEQSAEGVVPEEGKEAGDPNETKPAEAPVQPDAKAAQKFAEMRVQIRQYESVLTDVAKVLGIQDTRDPSAVMAAINDLVLKAQAKAQGIPEELLRRDRETTERLNQVEQRELQAETYRQFQRVKDAHNLSDNEVASFAEQLSQVGKNPFATQMDLMTEYRLLNYDKLVAKAKQDAIKEEQARSSRAQSHSSTPNQRQGTGAGAPAQIDSVKALDAMMNKM